MTLVFGPAVLFLTLNLADVYNPLSLVLDSGPGEDPLRRDVNLLHDDPQIPALLYMKQRLSKNPRALAKLFLLMQELACRFLLGIDDVHIGRHFIQPRVSMAAREDDNAASGGPSLVSWPAALFAPVESQGRGFIPHAHMKVHAPVGMSVQRLRTLLQSTEHEAAQRLRLFSAALLSAGATIQYDSAVEVARQWNVQVPPEPFSVLQQRQTKFDGGVEEDGTQRRLCPVTDTEVQDRAALGGSRC